MACKKAENSDGAHTSYFINVVGGAKARHVIFSVEYKHSWYVYIYVCVLCSDSC